MSVYKLLVGGLLLGAIAVTGLVIPTSVYATANVLGGAYLNPVHARVGVNGATLGVELYDEGDEPVITDTVTSTLSLSVPMKIPLAISNFFSGTISGTVSATDVISLHVSGMGFGEIFRLYYLSFLSGQSPDEILALRESGMGWGNIAKSLGQAPGNKGTNLGAAVSGRMTHPVTDTQTTTTTVTTTNTKGKSDSEKGKPAVPPGQLKKEAGPSNDSGGGGSGKGKGK